jgi:alpha-glucosidase
VAPHVRRVALGPPVDDTEHHVLLRSWRRLLDGYDSRMAVGEIASLDPSYVARYYGEALDELHLAFNFEFMRRPWSAEAFRRSTDLLESVLPADAWPEHTLSNHDIPRARSRFDVGDGESGRRRARVAMLMLLTLRGTPFIYYGEEIGQSDGAVPPDRVVDVAGRDPERTPMQWDAGPGAGFTTWTPWLPIGDGAAQGENVAAQAGHPDSMLGFTRRAIWRRKGSAALRWGSYMPVEAGEGVFAYVRDAADERLLVALDFGGRSRMIDLGRGRGTIVLATDRARERETVDVGRVQLNADEGIVVRLDEAATP